MELRQTGRPLLTLKILQISSAQSLGGGERHLSDLADGLVSRGHDVHVAVRPKSPLLDQLGRVPHENLAEVPLRNSLDAKSARELSRMVRRHQFQIVHAHMARDYPLAAYAARANPKARLIITRHVLFRLKSFHRITFAKAARVIAVSEAVAAQLRSERVVSSEKIVVVPNGIDVDALAHARNRFDRSKFLAEWKLPEDCLLVGTVGELSPLKGQAEFLHAAAKVAQDFPNAYFIIAGADHSLKNENRIQLERLIEDLALRDRVRLVGWLEDVAEVYCALDVFVSASQTESFGLAMAEAMAAQTSVVATATEGAQEIIEPGKTGLLVEVGNVEELAREISVLLGDEMKRNEMAEAARISVTTRFSVEKMIEETENIYREVLEEI